MKTGPLTLGEKKDIVAFNNYISVLSSLPTPANWLDKIRKDKRKQDDRYSQA